MEGAVGSIGGAGGTPAPPPEERPPFQKSKRASPDLPPTEYAETHHTEGKPKEVVEIYRALDRFCQELAPGRVTRTYQKKTVNWTLDKAIFCCAHLQQSGLRVWVTIDPDTLDPSASFARDVLRIGHWGVGDVELKLNSLDRLHDAEAYVRKSFENVTRK